MLNNKSLKKNFSVPLCAPNLDIKDRKNLINTFDEKWVSTAGTSIKEFEIKFKKYVGSKYAIACNSGTSALHLALKISGVLPGDEVLLPSLTFAATANAIIYNQAKPIFFNVDEFLNIKFDDIESFLKEKTEFINGFTYNKNTKNKISAILPVHMYGNACNLNNLVNLLKNRNIKIIEDAAESLGTKIIKGKYNLRHTGTIGEVGIFSFNANKIITSGSGGMIVTNKKSIANRAYLISNQAKKNEINYIHEEVGYNYRMNCLCASLGITQLNKINKFLEKKKYIYNFYKKIFNNSKNIEILSTPDYSQNNHWMPILKLNFLKNSSDKKKFISALQKKNIQIRGCWDPLHFQKPYKNFQNYKIKNLINKTNELICLPCSTNITNRELAFVSKTILDLIS